MQALACLWGNLILAGDRNIFSQPVRGQKIGFRVPYFAAAHACQRPAMFAPVVVP